MAFALDRAGSGLAHGRSEIHDVRGARLQACDGRRSHDRGHLSPRHDECAGLHCPARRRWAVSTVLLQAISGLENRYSDRPGLLRSQLCPVRRLLVSRKRLGAWLGAWPAFPLRPGSMGLSYPKAWAALHRRYGLSLRGPAKNPIGGSRLSWVPARSAGSRQVKDWRCHDVLCATVMMIVSSFIRFCWSSHNSNRTAGRTGHHLRESFASPRRMIDVRRLAAGGAGDDGRCALA